MILLNDGTIFTAAIAKTANVVTIFSSVLKLITNKSIRLKEPNRINSIISFGDCINVFFKELTFLCSLVKFSNLFIKKFF